MSARRRGSSARAAIVVFVVTPWVMGLAHQLVRPDPPGNLALKDQLARQRGVFDTAIVGDSRVSRVGGEPFAARGWRYFNMGMSGLSPEDTALELQYAISRQPILRVVMDASFENMSEAYPFEHSRYYREAPFRDLSLAAVAGFDVPRPNAVGAGLREWGDWFSTLLPVGSAAGTVFYYRDRIRGTREPEYFNADGSVAYRGILADIRSGTYNFPVRRNPQIYFDRSDGESRYLETARLSDNAKALYAGMFDLLRRRRIPTVVFESVKTQEYQRLIDDSPLLARLQGEWRAWYRSQSRGCVRFVDADRQRGVYDDRDFFDAAHYAAGTTEPRLNELLAAELSDVEAMCRSSRDGEASK